MNSLIIAEAGVNHNGELSKAKELVEVAAAAGADFVKFQSFDANRLASASARKADYQLHVTDEAESQRDMLRRLELSVEMHRVLIAQCKTLGIGFLSTGFDIESVDFLAGLGQELFKIPSGEITNLPYLRHVGGLGKDIILSTGMATLGEIEAAVDVIEQAGTPRASLTILHCTSEYPAPMDAVNLRVIQTLRLAFGVNVGYSDHTSGIEVAVAAVALGALVIEKHFTLDRTLPGPDHKASLEPDELKAMISAVRNIEIALGDGVKRISPVEDTNKIVSRKSIVARHAIKTGHTFSVQNVATKRPGTGISPMRWDEVIGRTAPRDFEADEPIEL